MATANVTLYSSRAAARKGAKRAGMLAFDIIAAGDKFKFISTAEAVEPSTKATAPRAGTKVGQVIAMCQNGCTLEQISETLSVSKTAAASLIGDAKRKGVQIKVEKSPAGVNVYRVA